MYQIRSFFRHDLLRFATAQRLWLVSILSIAFLAGGARTTKAAALDAARVDMKVLVLSATGNTKREPYLGIAIQALQSLGIPYEHVHLTNNKARRPGVKLDLRQAADHGRYYGIVLTTDQLLFENRSGQWVSALTPAEWADLRSYQVEFGVRNVSLTTVPRPNLGVTQVGQARSSPTQIELAQGALPHAHGLKQDARIDLKYSWYYPAVIADPQIATPFLNFRDLDPNPVSTVAAVVSKVPEGWQQLSFFFTQSEFLMPSIAYAHLWCHWLTKGLYIGKRRVLLNPEVDDLFLDNELWAPKPTSANEVINTYRIKAQDFGVFVEWQDDLAKRLPKGSDVKTEFAFNGVGVFRLGGGYGKDRLFAAARKYKKKFHWVNHTFTHPDLTRYSFDRTMTEIEANFEFGRDFLDGTPANFSLHSMVTPRISGLFNAEALRAFFASDVTTVVGDNSQVALRPSHPYHARYSTVDRNGFEGVLIVPRHATQVPVGTGTLKGFTEFYNHIYHNFWGRDLTGYEIYDLEAERVAKLLLSFRHDPYMFHQTNLWTFPTPEGFPTTAKRSSLLSLWIDTVTAKLNRINDLPILSLKLDDIATEYRKRMTLDDCRLKATLTTESGEPKTLELSTRRGCEVPITTASVTGPAVTKRESYGPDKTFYVDLKPGAAATLAVSIDHTDGATHSRP